MKGWIVSQELISVAAYYRAENRDFLEGDELADLLICEKEVDYMATGKAKWINDDMGFGFVTPDNGCEELFAHHSEINMSGLKLLKKGPKSDL